MNSHQSHKDSYQVRRCKECEENQHPQSHTLLVFLILFVLSDAVFVFADALFGFWRNIDAAHATMLV